MSINLSALMKQRYDTAANWTAQNPTLLAGEIGIESDTKKWKVGTGATAWTSLVYAIGGTYPIVNADIAAAAAIVDTKLATIATAGKVSGTAITSGNISTSGSFTSTSTVTGTNLIPTGSGVPTNGIYLPAANSVAVATNGTGRLFVDASGKVGVSEPSAQANLHVAANISDATAITWANSQFSVATPIPGNSTANRSTIYFAPYGSDNNYAPSAISCTAGTGGASTLKFVTNASGNLTGDISSYERLRITSAGLVGIGNSSPTNTLHVVGSGDSVARISAASDTNLTFSETTANKHWKLKPSVGDFYFQYSGTAYNSGYSTLLSIKNTGRVGIGTTTVDTTLHIKGANTSGRGQLYIQSTATNVFPRFILADSANTTYLDMYGDTSNQEVIRNTGSGGKHVWQINSSEAARIDSSGRLLVGTSSTSSTALLQVQGNSSSSTGGAILQLRRGTNNVGIINNTALGSIEFSNTESTISAVIAAEADANWNTTNDYPSRLVFSTTADGGSSPTEAMRINNGQELLVGYTSDNGAYKLQVNSQIFATSATVATSDGRYKENVSTLGDCVDLVKALRPVSFTWKPQEDITRTDEDGNEVLVREGHNFPDGTQVGFIAQDIKQNVRPSVNDSNGNELAPEEEFFGIAEGNLTAVLTSALQEAIAKIEALESRLSALEAA
jgi:hypothetical protein